MTPSTPTLPPDATYLVGVADDLILPASVVSATAITLLPTSTPERHPLTGWWHVVGADTTGVANSSSVVQAAIDAAKTAGGGVVYLPAGIIQAEVTIRNRVILRGNGERQTTIMAAPGSANPGIIQFETGYNQNTWLEDLSIVGNGNSGQHGVFANAQPISPNNNGGWWEGGMRRIKINSLTAADCIHFTSVSNTGLLPHQFLIFEHVFCGAPVGGHAIYSDSQTGQIVFLGGEYDGPGLGTGTTANVDIEAGYTWTFIGSTFQNNLQAVLANTAQQVTLIGCYFENIGQAVTAAGSATVSVVDPHLANAGYVSATDSSGYLFKATGSRIQVRGGAVTGSYTKAFVCDSTGIVDSELLQFPFGSVPTSTGLSKQIAVNSSGQISPQFGVKTAFVNTSATPIISINGSRGEIAGDELNLLAFGGTIILSGAGTDGTTNIHLGGQADPLTVPQNGVVTLLRMDSVVAWVIKSVSFPT
jgi:hypothetical protein